MRPSLALLCLSLFACIPLCNAGADPNEGHLAYYTELRMNYAQRDGYDPAWDHAYDRQAIFDAYKAGDFPKTHALAKAWLEKVPVDAEIHLLRALASKRSGDFAGYCAYMVPFYGLLHSITSTGDGRTPETAFKVIAVAEEYFLLREIGATVKQQSLVGHCDKLEVSLRGGETCTLYFDVRISLEAMNRLFKTAGERALSGPPPSGECGGNKKAPALLRAP